MKAQRITTKLLLDIAFVSATIMAFPVTAHSFAASFSENAVTALDPFLRAYLNPASVAFALMAGYADFRYEKFTFIEWKFTWQTLFVFESIAFMLVSITNVSQLYIPHIIATACVALGAYVMNWNYFETQWKRDLSITLTTLAISYFVATFVLQLMELTSNVHTVARGEWVISLIAIIVARILINEKIR